MTYLYKFTVMRTRRQGMHNLRTVYNFEVTRALKKKSFWIIALAFPLAAGAIFGIVTLSNQATEDVAKKMKDSAFSVAVTDESGVIHEQTLNTIKAKTPETKQEGIDLVKKGDVEAFFYYPKDLAKDKAEVYGQDIGMFDNGKYESVAKELAKQSATAGVNPNTAAILKGETTYQFTTYRDGEVYDGVSGAIVPGLFLVLFYFLIVMFGNQMLTSTTEEKENRVIEMILTTVKARVLILGKILSLITLAIIQSIVFITPVIIFYVFMHDKLSLPSLDLTTLEFDPARILAAIAIFAGSFLLFTGLLVAIGAASPTAKEASGYLGIVMMLIFGPLYAFPLFLSSPDSPFVQFLTYFPFTSPIPALLRNAVGNLTVQDTLIVITLLLISSVIVMRLAVQLFQSGAIEYTRTLMPAFLQKKKK